MALIKCVFVSSTVGNLRCPPRKGMPTVVFVNLLPLTRGHQPRDRIIFLLQGLYKCRQRIGQTSSYGQKFPAFPPEPRCYEVLYHAAWQAMAIALAPVVQPAQAKVKLVSAKSQLFRLKHVCVYSILAKGGCDFERGVIMP